MLLGWRMTDFWSWSWSPRSSSSGWSSSSASSAAFFFASRRTSPLMLRTRSCGILCYFITYYSVFLWLCFFITFLVFTPRPADQVPWNLVTSPKLFYIIRNYSDRGISYLMDFQLYVIHIYVREGSRYQIGWIFGKVPWGASIFNPKFYVADFGNFK